MITGTQTTEDQGPVGDLDSDIEARGRWSYARTRFFRNRFAMASVVVLISLFAAGFLAPQIAPYGYQQTAVSALSQSPSWSHPFGTDQYGFDYFSLVLYGIGTTARVALLVGVFGTLFGVLVGVIAGFYGGWSDHLLMRLADIMLAVPALAAMLTAAAFLQLHTFFSVALLLAVILSLPFARVVRASSFSLRETEFIDAAVAVGASDVSILRRHFLPNLVAPIAVSATLLLSSAVLFEVALSFLGFGASESYAGGNPHAPSLGDVLVGAQQAGTSQWWGETFPGLTIVVIVVCINAIGEGFRDALDPAPRSVKTTASRRRRARWISKRTARLGRTSNVDPSRIAPAPAHPRLGARFSVLLGGSGEIAVVAARKAAAGLAYAAQTVSAISGRMIPARPARASRARRRRRLLLEAFVVIGVVAVAAGTLYFATVHRIESAWPLAGSDAQNLSRAEGVQSEASLAIDPANPRVLLAGSNDGATRTLVYSSDDGGRGWSKAAGPASAVACGPGDPAVTIDSRGHEYYALLLSHFCGHDFESFLVVAERDGSFGRWRLTKVAAPSYEFGFDDKPAIAVDNGPRHRGRVYVVWSRLLSNREETFVLSHSDDDGRSWTYPAVVDRAVVDPILPSITIDNTGDVYVAGIDARLGVWLARSDGGDHTFQVVRAATLTSNRAATCATVGGGRPVAGQAYRCIGPDPTIATTPHRVYVTYADMRPNGSQDIRVASFDQALHRLSNAPVGPPGEQKANQFWPVSATDPATSDLWVCFYDTSGDKRGTRAWFTCTLSHDGLRWASPVRVVRAPSSVEALWSDTTLSSANDQTYSGGYVALAASHGIAHPVWIDTNGTRDEEIYSARLDARIFHGG